jgi:uncharacterized protein
VPEHLEPQHLARLPLFPLPGVVFLPHTLLPLYVFEPRYRKMITWCLAHDWPLAVPLLPHGVDPTGDPLTVPITGVGDIAHHEELQGGRFQILLRGLGRARIVEDSDKEGLIRMARLEPIHDEPIQDMMRAIGQVTAMRALIRSLSRVHPQASEALDSVLADADDPAVMVDCVGSVLYREPVSRQTFLEEPSVDARLDRVVDDLADLIGGISKDESPGDLN